MRLLHRAQDAGEVRARKASREPAFATIKRHSSGKAEHGAATAGTVDLTVHLAAGKPSQENALRFHKAFGRGLVFKLVAKAGVFALKLAVAFGKFAVFVFDFLQLVAKESEPLAKDASGPSLSDEFVDAAAAKKGTKASHGNGCRTKRDSTQIQNRRSSEGGAA